MENTELQQSIQFEDKVDIEDLLLPSEPTGILSMETTDIKEEPLEQNVNTMPIHENKPDILNLETLDIKEEPLEQSNNIVSIHESKSVEFDPDKNEVFQSEMEDEIVKLFEEFDMMNLHDYDEMRVRKVKQLVEKYQGITQKVVFKLHEKTLEVKTNELKKTKEELEMAKSTVLTLSKRIQELQMASNQVSNQKENVKYFDKQEVPEKSEEYVNNQENGNMSMHPVNEGKKPFRCDMCDYSCSEIGLMKSHVESLHDGNKPNKCTSFDSTKQLLPVHEGKKINCPYCKVEVPTKRHLNVHIQTVYVGKTSKCSQCKVEVEEGEEHQYTHQCTKCNEEFSTKKKLSSHFESGHGGKQSKCVTCNIEFSDQNSFNTHLSKVHTNFWQTVGIKSRFESDNGAQPLINKFVKLNSEQSPIPIGFLPPSGSQDGLPNEPPNEPPSGSLGGPPTGHYGHLNTLKPISSALTQSFGSTKTNTYNCDSCNVVLTNKRALSLHVTNAHSGQILPKEVPKASVMGLESNTEISSQTDLRTLSVHKNVHKNRYHQTKCQKQGFVSKPEMSKEPKPFQCKNCSASYTSPYRLKTHVEKHHQANHIHIIEDKRPFKCIICNVSYASKKDLNEHKVRIHGIVMPFKCGNCNSGFWRKQELLNHVLRSHEGKGKLYLQNRRIQRKVKKI